MKSFTDALALVEDNAADPVSTERAIYGGAIPGMLRRLDPFTVFFDPGQFEQLKQMEKSIQKGFGTVVSVLSGRVIVLQTAPNTPASNAGVLPGDEIIGINGYPLAGLDPEQLIGLLSQARQQQIRIDVRRPGNARILPFFLTPASVESPSVDRAFLLRPGYGMIHVASFDEKTAASLKEAIERLGGAKLKGLVLDLRGNPGGLVPAALATASYFLQPGQRILSVRGRVAAKGQEVDVPKDAQPYTFPLIVLVNEKSASASEIVAGALQDHDRATIIGEPTYGKGLVQSVYPLAQNTGLALTTAYYYTPSGRSIQKPIKDSTLAETTATKQPEFYTEKGKVVRGGGGIQPDLVVRPEGASPLREALELSGSFAQFATVLLRRVGKIDETFTLASNMLDEYKVWLAERRIQPTISEWSAEREYARSRLLQEVFNQALGVEKGDEIEAQRDPQVKRALAELGQ